MRIGSTAQLRRLRSPSRARLGNPPDIVGGRDIAWRDDALCQSIDPEVFFADDAGSTSEAKTICSVCLTVERCLRYALENNERYGVWGGFTAAERRVLRRGRRTGLPIDETLDVAAGA